MSNMDILYRAPPNALMYTRTTQFGIFKNICDSISGLLGDGNFKVTQEGIVLQHMDPHRNCIVKLVLDKFEHHYCKRDFYMGFSIAGLYEEIRYVSGEMIVFCIEEPPEDATDKGADLLRIYVYNEEEVSKISIPLYKNVVEDYEFDGFEYASRVVSMPNNRFQRLIKKVGTNAAKQTIIDPVLRTSTKAKICYIRCQDDMLIFGSAHKNGRENQSVIQPHPRKTAVRWCAINPNVGDDNFVNHYFTRYLEKFCKHQLDEKVILYMKKDFILALRYILGDLGYISFMLAPIPPDTIDAKISDATEQEIVRAKNDFDISERRKRPRVRQQPKATKRPRETKTRVNEEEPDEASSELRFDDDEYSNPRQIASEDDEYSNSLLQSAYGDDGYNTD